MKSLVPHSHGDPGTNFDMPTGRSFIALLEAFRVTGGTVPGEIVGRLLEDHQIGDAVSLTKLIYTGQAFGFEWRDSLWIPMFQFDANDLALKASAQCVLVELPSLWSGWNVASWFAAPSERLDGDSPANRFDSDLEAVVQAAQSMRSVVEFAVLLERRVHAVGEHV